VGSDSFSGFCCKAYITRQSQRKNAGSHKKTSMFGKIVRRIFSVCDRLPLGHRVQLLDFRIADKVAEREVKRIDGISGQITSACCGLALA